MFNMTNALKNLFSKNNILSEIRRSFLVSAADCFEIHFWFGYKNLLYLMGLVKNCKT